MPMRRERRTLLGPARTLCRQLSRRESLRQKDQKGRLLGRKTEPIASSPVSPVSEKQILKHSGFSPACRSIQGN